MRLHVESSLHGLDGRSSFPGEKCYLGVSVCWSVLVRVNCEDCCGGHCCALYMLVRVSVLSAGED